MLSERDNDVLCQVGPGTPMGEVMRQYWLPLLTSDELPTPDCPPLRTRLLGENLIAFRTTSGSVGLIQNSCPHRGASMFFGRNEEEGLRCVYHGWKFDTEGTCVDMPSEPAESNFKNKVRTTAYATQERSGIIWAYMGPRSRDNLPPLPEIEPNMRTDGDWRVQKAFRECNYMQGLEGDIDTAHLAFLHLGKVEIEDTTPGGYDYYTIKDKAPRYDVLDTEIGTSYTAYRPAEADTYYYRVAHFLFPCFTMIPTGDLGKQILVRAWVPIDDEHMMFWNIAVPSSMSFGQGGRNARPVENPNARQAAALTGGRNRNQNGGGMEYLPHTSDWLGRWRLTQNRDNDYQIDREAQATNSYTGIAGIHQQDQAITESMGQVYDRSHEHLGTSDAMVIRTRRRLINVAKAMRDTGTLPPGVDKPELYRIRSGGTLLPRNVDWIQGTKHLREPEAVNAFIPV